jgi:hypothetical protein
MVRAERRRTLYRYARTVLGLSVAASRECSYSVAWMVRQFPGHLFPESIMKLAKRGVKRAKL